jgi:hypothetical protein
MRTALLLVILVVAAGMAFIRLAPSDPARWHVDPAPPTALPPYCSAPGPRNTSTRSTVSGSIATAWS